MEPLTGATRFAFLGFFLSHIPATVLLDGQFSYFPLPYPQFLSDFLVNKYAVWLNDPLFQNVEPWFQAFLTLELVIQLPFFFVAVSMFRSSSTTPYPEWFRLCSLIYGASTSTTLVPILYIVLTNPSATIQERTILGSIYLPYLIFPLWLTVLAFQEENAKPMTPLRGAVRTAMYIFFASHIPIAICIDSQAAFPMSIYPSPLIDLVEWYVEVFGDELMKRPIEKWFAAVGCCEICFQLPFFCIMCYHLSKTRTTTYWPAWLRSGCIVYGSHVATTLVPIYVSLFLNPNATVQQKAADSCIYFPYLAFPVWLVYLCSQDGLRSNKSYKRKTT